LANTLIAEKPEHADAIERVLDRAFGPGRFAKTSERVRERCATAEPGLSRVAVDGAGAIVGVCRIWRVRAGAELFFLGPLAVDPAVQLAGLGAALTRDCVSACRTAGGPGVILVGAVSFFAPLGFSVVPAGRVRLPGPVDPGRLLWCELKPGGLAKVEGDLTPVR
jgi:predicted N-acetyltransferase YhbS